MEWHFFFCILATMNPTKLIIATLLLSGTALYGTAQPAHTLTVRVDAPTATIKPTMWGVFFEDINLAADGGLYAELVKNRSFEFNLPLMGWKEQKKGSAGGTILVINRSALKIKTIPAFIRVKNAATGNYGMSNEGFRGMGVEKNKHYNFSVLARRGKRRENKNAHRTRECKR
jgi:alpha-N-arabinofuranosidase